MTITARLVSWRAPHFERLEVWSIPDEVSLVQALLSSQIDVATIISWDQAVEIEGAGHATAIVPSFYGAGVALINTKGDAPFDDVRVHHALNYAVNKEAMVEHILGGVGRVSSQPAVASMFGFDPSIEPYPYDPERARQLLAEAGYADGFRFGMEVFPGGISHVASESWQQIAIDRARVGVDMEINTIGIGDYVTKFVNNTWDAPAFGSIYSGLINDAIVTLEYNSCAIPKPWYCNKDVTPLFDQSSAAFEKAARKAILGEVLRRYHDEALFIYLIDAPDIAGASKRLTGVKNMGRTIKYHAIRIIE